MDHDDIVALILAVLGFLGGGWALVQAWIRSRSDTHKVDHQAEIQSRQITNDFITSLEKRIDQLLIRIDNVEKKSDQQDAEIDRLREQLRIKDATIVKQDARIVELERAVSERELKIEELEKEVTDLRERLEVVEKRKPRGSNQ